MKKRSYGEGYELTIIDKLGIYLSNQKIINYVRKFKPRRIIDIGCGYQALLLVQLRKYNADLTGVDVKIDKKISGVKLIQKKISKDLSFLESNSTDLVVMNSVLEHLDYPLLILKEIYRIMDTNSMLILNVPNWIGKFFLEFSAFKLRLSPIEEVNDHKMYYDKRDIWPLLIQAGFKPININISYHKFFLNTISFSAKRIQ